MHGPFNTSTTAVKDVSGRRLARRLHRISAVNRALLAHELENGVVSLHRLTRKQACALVGASAGYVATLNRASAAERELVKRGRLSLATLHNRPSDAKLDRVVAWLGPDRVMAALDRATAPERAAAE